MMKIFKVLFLSSALLCYKNTLCINIIFDLGGVLFDTRTSAVMQEIGIKKFLMYALTHPDKIPTLGSHLRQRLFTILNATLPRNTDESLAKDESGLLIPQIMCNWLKGSTTNCQTLDYLVRTCKQHPEYFESAAEQRLIMATIKIMFAPTTLAKTRTVVSDMATFARACNRQGHKLYVLSNWDSESFEHVKALHPKLFSLFNGVVISGDCHSLKPSPEPFKKLLTTYNLNPQDCLFIDDRPENCATAQELGITSVVYARNRPWYSWYTTSNRSQIQQQLTMLTQHHPSAVPA